MLISRSESYRIGDSNCLWFFCGTLHLCSFLNIEQHEIKDFIRCHPAPESAPTSCVASGGPGQVKSSSLLGSYQLISRISFFIMMQPVTSFVHKHDGFQFLANQLSWENYRSTLHLQGRNCIFPFTYLGVKYKGCAPLYG